MMKRLDYFNTRNGQRYLRRQRKASRLHFPHVAQEPKSKNAISTPEKISFQNEILKVLNKRRRRAYRSPVIVEIDFYSGQDNPPSIHTLAKNYIDLLEDPIPQCKTRRSKLLYNDDRLIKILIVHHHLGMPSFSPGISIKVDTLSNFISDIALVERIKRDDFKKDDDCSWSSSRSLSDFDLDNLDDCRDGHEFEESIAQLRELERDKHSIIKSSGTEFYGIQREWLVGEAQKGYLEMNELGIGLLPILFSLFLNKKSCSGISEIFKNLAKQHRNLIASPPVTIDLTHVPLKEREKQIFKSNLRKILNDFKAKHPILFPLRNLLSITVLYVPPRHQSIDLDNLARYIIPFVNDIIMPPATFLNTIDIDHMKDSHIKKKLIEEIEKMPRIPKYSITKYQVIELPRFDDDSDKGYVRLLFGNGITPGSLWSRVDDAIGKWEDIAR